MTNHSILPPSKADVWGKPDGCTGWVLLSQQFPETSRSVEADDGIASHEMAAKLIHLYALGCVTGAALKRIGDINITKEMLDAAIVYADHVQSVMRSTGVFGGKCLGVEEKVIAPRVHELSFGTPDCYLYDKNLQTLHIWDYKSGLGTVEVFENYQLINYAAGIMHKLCIDGDQDQRLKIRFYIVQPRGFHRQGPIRVWTVNGANLRSYINILSSNATEALSADAVTRTGSHCRYCCARHACKAALSATTTLYETAIPPEGVTLSNEAIGSYLSTVKRARKHLESLDIALTAQAEAKIFSGEPVRGWRMAPKKSSMKWATPVENIIALGKFVDIDLKKPDATITPRQAISKGVDETYVKAYVADVKPGMTLTEDSLTEARYVFSQ